MRCYLSPDQWQDGEVVLPADESHYALNVLRATVGTSLELFDGSGRIAEAEIVAAQRGTITLHVSRSWSVAAPEPTFHLLQALPRAQKMDLIIQKATELGVTSIVPVRTEHAMVRLEGDRARKKVERWQTVALAAARQCGAAWVPVIQPVQDLAAVAGSEVRLLVGELGKGSRPLKEVLSEARAEAVGGLGVVIGPEGDFSDAEREVLRAAGAIPVSLGPSVLRTETAALYALSALRYEFR